MKALIFIVFFLFSLNIFGAEIQAELQLISAPATLKEGDLIESVLNVWPIENADLDEFKPLESMIFANALNVIKVESIGISANNADVVEAKMLLIVKRTQENSNSPLKYKDQVIQVQIPPLKIEATNQVAKDYYVMDQGTIRSYLGRTIAGAALIICIVLAALKRKSIKKLFQKFKADPTKATLKKYDELFSKASTRQDLEEIYALRKEWLNLVKVQAPAYRDFFRVMEQHQYKECWTNDEMDEVKSSFEVICRSFK
jgi:hypothetical protein